MPLRITDSDQDAPVRAEIKQKRLLLQRNIAQLRQDYDPVSLFPDHKIPAVHTAVLPDQSLIAVMTVDLPHLKLAGQCGKGVGIEIQYAVVPVIIFNPCGGLSMKHQNGTLHLPLGKKLSDP